VKRKTTNTEIKPTFISWKVHNIRLLSVRMDVTPSSSYQQETDLQGSRLFKNAKDRWTAGNLLFKKLRSTSRRSKYRLAVKFTKEFIEAKLPKNYDASDLVNLYLRDDYNAELSAILRGDLKFNFNLAIVKPTAYSELEDELRRRPKPRAARRRTGTTTKKAKKKNKSKRPLKKAKK